MNTQPLQDAIEQRISDAIQRGLEMEKDRIIAEFIDKSKAELEKQLKEVAARVALKVCRKVSLEPYGMNAIKIIVEFPENEK